MKKIAILILAAILLGLFLAGSLIAEEQEEERLTYIIITHTQGSCGDFTVWVSYEPEGPPITPGHVWQNDHYIEINLPVGSGYYANAEWACGSDCREMQPFVDCHLYLCGGIVDPTIPAED